MYASFTLWSSVRDSSGTTQYAAPMNPVSTHTTSRFVWITLATSKGRTLSSGSGPRYFVAASKPNASCKPNSTIASAKYQ